MSEKPGPWNVTNDPLRRVQDEGLEKVLPKRNKGERRAAFVDRCMASEVSRREFPDAAQRLAVCNSQAAKEFAKEDEE